MAVTRIDVEVARPRPDRLLLHYVVPGKIGDLRLPPVTPSARAGELWRHTCFEAFLCAPPGAAYYEFNFAPSTQWAAYRFSTYREGMSWASEIGAPRVEARSSGALLELEASLTLPEMPGWPRHAPWLLGLSAVIEEESGALSYWALAHPPGKADFHHPDSFALQLPAPARS